jgi:hypothetical protein
MNLSDERWQLIVRYGGIAAGIVVFASVYLVVRNWELYRHASQAEMQFQRFVTGQQTLQGVLQELAARASSDAGLAEVFRRAQQSAAAGAAGVPATGGQP